MVSIMFAGRPAVLVMGTMPSSISTASCPGAALRLTVFARGPFSRHRRRDRTVPVRIVARSPGFGRDLAMGVAAMTCRGVHDGATGK
jgi:hypothetical protein